MLSCRELSTHYASDYVDGCLPLRKRLAVGIHLAICRTCRRFLHQIRLVKGVLRTMPDLPLADVDSQALATRLHTDFQRQQKNTPD